MKPAAIPRRKRGNPEADIQREIVKELRWILPAGSIVHCSANEIRGGGHHARIQQGINSGMGVHPGFSDLIVMAEGRILCLEVKSKSGRQSDVQIAFQKLVEQQGHAYEVVRSVVEVREALVRHGFKTRLKSPLRSALPTSGSLAQKIGWPSPARKNGRLRP